MKTTLFILLTLLSFSVFSQRAMQNNDLSPINKSTPVTPDTSGAGDNLILASNSYFAAVALGIAGLTITNYATLKGDEAMMIAGSGITILSFVFQARTWIKIKKAGKLIKKKKL